MFVVGATSRALGTILEEMSNVANNKLDNILINQQRARSENAWVDQGYSQGVGEASLHYKSVIKKNMYALTEASDRVKELEDRFYEEESESIKIKRKEIITDCQKAGYIQAIGMFKAIIDYDNKNVRDLDGKLVKMNTYLNKDGTSGAIYDKKSGVHVDHENMQDVMHENGELSIYETCFYNGFKQREAYLREIAKRDHDSIAQSAMGIGSLEDKAFVQTPEDARMFKKLEDAGRYYFNGTVVPEMEKDMAEVYEFFRSKGISQKELEVFTKDKRSKEIRMNVLDKDDEQEAFRKNGMEKEYFV